MEISWNETLTLQLISAVQKVEDDWGIREWEDQDEMWRLIADELPLNFLGTLGVDLQDFSDLCKARFLMLCRCFNDVFIKYTRHNCLTYKVMTALAGYSLRSDCNAFFREIGPKEHFRAIVSVGVERFDIEYCASRGPGCGGLAASEDSPNMVKREVEELRTIEQPGEDELPDEDSKDSQEKRSTLRKFNKDELLEDFSESQQKRSTLGEVIQEELLDDFKESQERGSILGELIEDELLDEDSNEILDFRATPRSEDPSEEENNSSFSGFVVNMKKWNVRKGLVTVPRHFGLEYMPRCNTTLLTFIRNNKKYLIKYLPHNFSLSGGWKNFARANKVKENDKLVFCRLDFSTYQVIILGRECRKKTLQDPGLHLYGRR